MAFIETPRFPLDVNFGTQGGPIFSTDVVRFGNGLEYRNQNWNRPLYRYNIQYRAKTRAEALEVYEFFLARQGRFEGFRAKDLWDFTSATNGRDNQSQTDQTIGTGDGSTTDFQLIKTYTQGSATQVRTILKPVVGTDLVEVDGVLQTGGGTDYTLDTTTGIISFNSPPADTLVIKAGFQFDVPVRFDTDELDNLQLLFVSATDDLVAYQSIPLVEIRNGV